MTIYAEMRNASLFKYKRKKEHMKKELQPIQKTLAVHGCVKCGCAPSTSTSTLATSPLFLDPMPSPPLNHTSLINLPDPRTYPPLLKSPLLLHLPPLVSHAPLWIKVDNKSKCAAHAHGIRVFCGGIDV
jgi:hypothetical protein